MTRILLVEDNDLNRDMLARRLTRKGFEVSLAVDGAESIEKAKAELPDLILMDISLPVMDGYEATRILKAGERTGHIPVLGLSAHAMSGDADKALRAGCDGYDTKPVDMRRLLGKIDDLLAASREKVEEAPAEAGAESGPTGSGAGASAAIAASVTPPPPGSWKIPAQAPTVRIEMPGEEARPAQRSPDERTPDEKLRGRLLIAGRAEQGQVLARQAAALGYGFELSGDAAMALELLKLRRYDALLLDHAAPGLDGEGLVRTLRADPRTRALPILLVSGMDAMERAFECIRLGADFFLPFPPSNHLLEVRLEACKEKRRSAGEGPRPGGSSS